jgi:magnesium-protoporphyrin O-methyltransferase
VVDFLSAHGLEGATVLEIGGGIGEVHLELLRRGAQLATNLEISTSDEDEAARPARGIRSR